MKKIVILGMLVSGSFVSFAQVKKLDEVSKNANVISKQQYLAAKKQTAEVAEMQKLVAQKNAEAAESKKKVQNTSAKKN